MDSSWVRSIIRDYLYQELFSTFIRKNAMLVNKLRPSRTDKDVLYTDRASDTVVWGSAADAGLATAADLAAHLADTSDAHDASAISITDAAADFTATDVEGALAELQADAEAHLASSVMDGDAAGGVLSGTYPNPGFAVDMATQAELNTHASGGDHDSRYYTEAEVDTLIAIHTGDTSGAHAASAISIADAANDFTATDVEGALAELQADAEADATALSDHIADTTDAHDASAISYAGGTGMSAVNVETAIDELANEKFNITGGTITGATTINHGSGLTINADASLAAQIIFQSSGVTKWFMYRNLTDNAFILQDDVRGASVLTIASNGNADFFPTLADTTTALKVSGQTVWHAGNDGASSGLDADTVDGSHASAFATATDLSNHLADASDAHDASAISYVGGTGMSATDVEAAIDELATEKMNVGGVKLRTPLGFAVAAPSVTTTPNVAMSLATGHTAQVIKVRSKIDSGTSVTFSVRKNGTGITGLTGLSATTTAATHTFTAVSVAEDDEIDIDITAVSGSPTNLMVTVFLEHSF